MARYSHFLGRRVEVQYRAGDIVLPASGLFVADSGRSIFLEQNFEQRGQHKHFRWEIPYQYLVRIEEMRESQPDTLARTPATTAVKSESPPAEPDDKHDARNSAAAAVGGRSLLSLPGRPRPA